MRSLGVNDGNRQRRFFLHGSIISAISISLCEVIYTFEPNLKYWLYSFCNISLKGNHLDTSDLLLRGANLKSSPREETNAFSHHNTKMSSFNNDIELHFLLLICISYAEFNAFVLLKVSSHDLNAWSSTFRAVVFDLYL